MHNINRRKILFSVLTFFGIVTVFRFGKKSTLAQTAERSVSPQRFLTQDGKLVEIEADKIPGLRKPADKHDIQNWVNKCKPL